MKLLNMIEKKRMQTLKIAHASTIPKPKEKEETLANTREKYILDNNDYTCNRYILNGISYALLDVYQSMSYDEEL